MPLSHETFRPVRPFSPHRTGSAADSIRPSTGCLTAYGCHSNIATMTFRDVGFFPAQSCRVKILGNPGSHVYCGVQRQKSRWTGMCEYCLRLLFFCIYAYCDFLGSSFVVMCVFLLGSWTLATWTCFDGRGVAGCPAERQHRQRDRSGRIFRPGARDDGQDSDWTVGRRLLPLHERGADAGCWVIIIFYLWVIIFLCLAFFVVQLSALSTLPLLGAVCFFFIYIPHVPLRLLALLAWCG